MKRFKIAVNDCETRYFVGHIDRQDLLASARVSSICYTNPNGDDIRKLQGTLKYASCCEFVKDSDLSFMLNQKDGGVDVYLDIAKNKLGAAFAEVSFFVTGKYEYSDDYLIEIKYVSKQLDLNCSIQLTENESYINTTEAIAILRCHSEKPIGASEWEYQTSEYYFHISSPYRFKNPSGQLTDHFESSLQIEDHLEKSIYIDKSSEKVKVGESEIMIGVRCENWSKKCSFPNTIKPQPKAILDVEMCNVRKTVTISSENQFLFDLRVKNESSSKWAETLNIIDVVSDTPFITPLFEHKTEPLLISPNSSRDIQIYLNGRSIRNLLQQEQVITLTVNSNVGTEIVHFRVASKAVDGDYITIILVAVKALNIDCKQVDGLIIYEGMGRQERYLTLRNTLDYELKNVRMWVSEGGSYVQCDKSAGDKYTLENNLVSIERMWPREFVEIRVSSLETSDYSSHSISTLAVADYCDKTEKTFSVTQKRKVPARLEMRLEKMCSDAYIKGDTKKVATVTLINNTNGEADPQKAESKDLSQMCIVDNAENQLSMLYVGDSEGVKPERLSLKPCEEKTVFVWFDAQYLGMQAKMLRYSLKCDGVTSGEKTLNVKNQGADREATHIFTAEEEICYSSEVTFITVGHIVTCKQTNENLDQYYSREGEKIVVTDLNYYLLTKEGEPVSQFDITNTEKILELIRKVSGWKNVAEDGIEIPVSYVCETPKRNEVIGGKYSVKPVIQKPKLKISLINETLNEVVLLNNQNVNIGYKYNNAILNIEKSCIFSLSMENVSIIPYEDYGVIIEKVCIKSNKDKEYIDLPCFEQNVKLYNGDNRLDFPIYILWNKLQEKKIPNEIVLDFDIKYNEDGIDSFLKFKTTINLSRYIQDNWYSIDLGTTGIVMSKLEGNEISLIELKDATTDPAKNIESDASIVSSLTIILEKGNNVAEIKMCPNKKELNQLAKFVFVPTKFIVGQNQIPFIRNCRCESIKLNEQEDAIKILQLTPEQLVTFTYQSLFEKLAEKDSESIERLIVTYPSTYVPKQLDVIRKILEPKCSFITFVPESDAVVAYYLNKKMNSKEGFPIVEENGQERILIYDMGAGTLDISYVILKKEHGKYIADLDRRVAIPVAGNYLDKLIFDEIRNFISQSIAEKDIKGFVKNVLKPVLNKGNEDCVSVLKMPETEEFIFKTGTELKVSQIAISDKIKEYIQLCSKDILNLFLGDSWVNEINTIVYSGRASQFQPLKDNFSELGGETWLIDETSISQSCLKYCVAEGAICYCQIFENEQNYGFKIINKNQYLRIGIIYEVETENKGKKKVYKELINPMNEDWEDITPINGTRYKSFEFSPTFLNLSRANKIQFIQTILEPEIVESTLIGNDSNPKWCFVNKLFVVSTDILLGDRSNVLVKFVIDENNQISLTFNEQCLPKQFGNENVENNDFYINSYWPYNIN